MALNLSSVCSSVDCSRIHRLSGPPWPLVSKSIMSLAFFCECILSAMSNLGHSYPGSSSCLLVLTWRVSINLLLPHSNWLSNVRTHLRSWALGPEESHTCGKLPQGTSFLLRSLYFEMCSWPWHRHLLQLLKFLSSDTVLFAVGSHKPTQSCSLNQPSSKFRCSTCQAPPTKRQKRGRVAVTTCWRPTTVNKPSGLFFLCLSKKFNVSSLWNPSREKDTDHSCFSKPVLKDSTRSLIITHVLCVLPFFS